MVSFGFNKAQAFAEIEQHTRRGILLIMLSTSLVLVVMWSGARRFIYRPLGQCSEPLAAWRLCLPAGHRRRKIRGRACRGRVRHHR